jgi:raffinose/stachyose/melibiose transport system substrate-binding protein
MLALRIGGKEAFEAAYSREGEGFDSPTFVKAGEMFKELIDLQPFQPGFLGAKYPDAAGYFGDGKAAMYFMGDFLYAAQQKASTSGKGVPDDQLDFVAFPAVEGGKGNEDVLGAVEGWLVAKGAPDEAIKFLRFFLNKENQTKMAAAVHIPLTWEQRAWRTRSSPLPRPFNKSRICRSSTTSSWAQRGRVVNDVSADLAAGAITPEEAAKTVEEAWQAEQ